MTQSAYLPLAIEKRPCYRTSKCASALSERGILTYIALVEAELLDEKLQMEKFNCEWYA